MIKSLFLVSFTFLKLSSCSPELGKWDFLNLTKETNYVGLVKNAFVGSHLDIRVRCSTAGQFNVTIGYMLRRTLCWEEYLNLDTEQAKIEHIYRTYYKSPGSNLYEHVQDALPKDYKTEFVSGEFTTICNDVINIHPHVESKTTADEIKKVVGEIDPEILPEPLRQSSSFSSSLNMADERMEASATIPQTRRRRETDASNVNARTRSKRQLDPNSPSTNPPVYILPHDGVYLLVVYVGAPSNTQTFTANVHVEMKSMDPLGYLSITDWPLLPFYGVMCGVYVILGLAWLIVCSLHWREILRIQFWIGAVLLLGMLEKAMFTAEYQNINNSGKATEGLILAAEVMSCGKRTLARMLVIIVSLGFGIVKPRLGPILHRVVGIGGLYFVLASIESVLRVIHPKNDPSNKTLLAAVPLAVIDASICWWVFSALIQTTRTLRLRRNLVKLSLYKHFTNTLVFAVISSIIFMLWSIKYHKVVDCLTEWRDLWVDEAFWHLLFSVILCVIMILWRPSQNNQRYAFSPLLDREEDYSSDEDVLYNDAWDGMKMRGAKPQRPDTPDGADPEEDPLKWVEENIPDIEGVLPVIDSEEEIETTKIEISKLQ
eukprot:GFUD01032264.1.p1 GENE.GFUD01032264.1~~GFUD01032264.1.p1  ORF type:complete len:600 (-),score=101.29 GFUD01032264.1:212-2011(-)